MWQDRTISMIGEENALLLRTKSVLIAGLGGVGAACAEALARAGVGRLILLDADCYEETNLNRQLFCLRTSLGMKKTDAARERLCAINPEIKIELFDFFLKPENIQSVFAAGPDFIADAIDTLVPKAALIKEAFHRGTNIISSAGTGNRLHPELLKIGRLSDTAPTGCPFAKALRKSLPGINPDVVYSIEKPIKVCSKAENGRHPPASISYLPPTAGFFMAGFIVNSFIKI